MKNSKTSLKNETRTNKKEDTEQIPEERFDLRILQSLRRIIRSTDIHSRKLVSRYNITGPQLACLSIISEKEPLTVTDLAKKIFLSKSTVVGIIDRLEQKEMAHRKRDNNDRRNVYITSAEKGKKLLEKAPRTIESSISRSFENLSDLEQLTITCSLERIVDILEAQDIQVPPYLSKTGVNNNNLTTKEEM